MGKLKPIFLATIMIFAIMGAGIGTVSAQDSQMPDHAGPPDDIKNWTSTHPVSVDSFENNETEEILEGAMRVDNEYSDNVSLNITESEGNFSFDITIPSELEATNVSFYVNQEVVESAGEISNLSLLIDDEDSDFYIDNEAGPGESPWVLFQVDEFSTKGVEFTENGDEDSGPSGEFTSEGVPDGVQAFLNTSTLQNVDEELSGIIRVQDSELETVSAEMVSNDEQQTTLTIENTVNNSTSFYVQSDAIEAVAGTDFEVLIDGEQTNAGLTENGGSSWVAFEIDSFSEREVTFQSTESGGSGTADSFLEETIFGVPYLAIGGLLIALSITIGFAYWYQRKQEQTKFIEN